jgi:Tol biopolymer transport system component
MRMLSKDPKQRPATATDVQRALADLDKEPIPAKSSPAPKRRWLLGIAVLALIALTILAAIRLLFPPQPPEEPSKSVVNVSVSQFTEQPGIEEDPNISPDGKFVVFASNATGKFDIYLQRIGGDRPINLTADFKDDDLMPAFSSDGDQIAFVSMGDPHGLYVMGATGEAKRRLTDRAYNPSWSHDGREIFFATEAIGGPYSRAGISELWAVEVESGKRRSIFKGDAVQPSASPGGQRIAYWSVLHGQRDIWTIGVDGKDPVAVTSDVPTDFNPVWSPLGDYLYFLSDRSGTLNLWRVPIDEASGQVLGDLEQLTSGSTNMLDLAVSRSGLFAYTNRATNYTLKRAVFEADAEAFRGDPVDVLKSSRAMNTLHISPDGKLLAYNTAPNDDIAVMDRDGKNRRLLTKDEHKDRAPVFSPDGKRIVFYSNRGGSYDLWLINVDGTGLRRLTETETTAANPVWSPDGRQIAFIGIDIDEGTYVINMPGKKPVKALEKLPGSDTPSGLISPTSWSPDGLWLAGDENNPREHPTAYVYSFKNQKLEKLADDSWQSRWLRDGKRLLILKEKGIVLIDRETKRQKELLRLPKEIFLAGYTLTADDSEIFYTTVHIMSDIWLLRVE